MILITKNQIEYNKLLESGRHNLADEQIRSRGNDLTYQLGQQNLAETRRANLERERQNRNTLVETSRHNVEGERLQRLLYGETARSNQAREAISYSQLQEQNRSNLAQESLSSQRNQTQQYTATTQRELGLRQADETERKNVVAELQTQAQTEISQALSKLQAARLEEETRHNKVDEQRRAIESVFKGVDLVQSAAGNVVGNIARIIPLL